jgi:biotin synthase-like enzyme
VKDGLNGLRICPGVVDGMDEEMRDRVKAWMHSDAFLDG